MLGTLRCFPRPPTRLGKGSPLPRLPPCDIFGASISAHSWSPPIQIPGYTPLSIFTCRGRWDCAWKSPDCRVLLFAVITALRHDNVLPFTRILWGVSGHSVRRRSQVGSSYVYIYIIKGDMFICLFVCLSVYCRWPAERLGRSRPNLAWGLMLTQGVF